MNFNITKTELKFIAQDLDTGRGYLKQLVHEKPWLSDLSRQYLCRQLACDSFPVFRSVAILKLEAYRAEEISPRIKAMVEQCGKLRAENVVSTSINPHTVLNIALEQASRKIRLSGDPVLAERMFGVESLGKISAQPVILRYEITLDRVLLYVPALISHVRTLYSDEELAKTRYKNRFGDTYRVPHIFNELEHRQENELIALVDGLEPAIFDTEGDTSLIEDAYFAVSDTFDAHQHTIASKKWRRDDMSESERASYLRDLQEFVKEFFNTTVGEHAIT